jgi:CsoR family transcriptional regulator, copper-sensing transcriptional repressor
MTKPGYTEDKQQRLQSRLSRIEGQVRGVQRMVDEDRYCVDVLTQISAIRAALDRVALSLIDDHARNCMSGSTHAGERDDQVDELMGALDRLLTR